MLRGEGHYVLCEIPAIFGATASEFFEKVNIEKKVSRQQKGMQNFPVQLAG